MRNEYGQNLKIECSASAAFMKRARCGVGGADGAMTSRVALRCDRQLLRNRAPLILTASRRTRVRTTTPTSKCYTRAYIYHRAWRRETVITEYEMIQ